jgi:hypothetical protein
MQQHLFTILAVLVILFAILVALSNLMLSLYIIGGVVVFDYTADDESTLITIPAGGALTYNTSAGFGIPGSAVSYKVYVRLTTGNEAGSDAVTVTRPV